MHSKPQSSSKHHKIIKHFCLLVIGITLVSLVFPSSFTSNRSKAVQARRKAIPTPKNEQESSSASDVHSSTTNEYTVADLPTIGGAFSMLTCAATTDPQTGSATISPVQEPPQIARRDPDSKGDGNDNSSTTPIGSSDNETVEGSAEATTNPSVVSTRTSSSPDTVSGANAESTSNTANRNYGDCHCPPGSHTRSGRILTAITRIAGGRLRRLLRI